MAVTTDLTDLARRIWGQHPCPPGGNCRCTLPAGDPIHQPCRIDADGYHVYWADGGEYLAHLSGVDWVDAPLPPRRHKCWTQTRGFILGDVVHRCACGAIRRNHGPWLDRNSRRRDEPSWWRKLLRRTR